MSIEVSLPENKYQLFDSQKYVKRFYNLGNRQMFSLSQTSIKLYNHYLNLSWDFFFFFCNSLHARLNSQLRGMELQEKET